MPERVDEADASLASGTSGGARIVSWFGHTGNFVIDAKPKAVPALRSEVPTALAAPCCIIPLEQLQDYIVWLDDLGAPNDRSGTQWTPGLAFLIDGQPSTVQIARADELLFERLAQDVVGVWKRRHANAQSKADLTISGGWGEISRILHQQLGGVWTVRSIRSVLGVLKRAALYAAQSGNA